MGGLAAGFGVDMSNRYAEEPTRHDPETDTGASWCFRREYPFQESQDADFRSAAGRAQGLAFSVGAGWVVVMGEAAMLTSQVARANGRELRFG